jgi:membrane protease YdiL (CAAX protease family)
VNGVAAMLVRTAPSPRRWRDDVLVVTFIAGGCALLASRTLMAPTSGSARIVVAAVPLTAILIGSLLVPSQRGPATLSPVAAAAVGISALSGAALVAGTPVPLAIRAWALPLSFLAAIAEEALFRKVAYGWLERWGPFVAVVGSAALFAVIHLPLYGIAVLPVDLGAGLVFGWQRWVTGSWETPAATHAAANLVAILR